MVATWKDALAARFANQRESLIVQGAPLIPSKGPRPLSSESLDPVQELLGTDLPPRSSTDGLAAATPNSPPVTATALYEKATSAAPMIPVVHNNSARSESRDIESNNSDSSAMRSIRSFMMEEIDTTQASAPLSAYCFMTGFTDAVCFSAVFVWCAFQTGNTVQLSLAIARLFNGQHDYTFHIADQQALCSVVTFILGALVGRIGDKIGAKTRMWMTMGTFIQTLFTMAAALTIWKSHSGSVGDNRGDPAWSNALSFVTIGFMSACMGLQGIMGKRLNTQFTTTVVLTTTWCELMCEPQLFNLCRLVASRDHKIMAIVFLFLGGFISRAILDKVGSPGTLGIATGLRFVITLWWLLVPAKQTKK